MERLRHLVVVVPGLFGSTLADRQGRDVWGPGGLQIGAGLLRPATISLAENPRLVPTGLQPTISIAPPVWRIPGYDLLIAAIRRRFPTAVVDTAHPDRRPRSDTDVLLVPYDFRVGVVAAASYVRDQVEKVLGELTASARARRVLVVGHSMGGLVARHWLGPGGGASDCAGLITVGTPHGGAPKALDFLVNGVRFGPVSFKGLTALAREWPSTYDLLPRYPAITRGDGQVHPRDLAVMQRLGVTDKVSAAYQNHLDIDEGWAEEGQPALLAIFGRGHRTPLRCDYDDDVLTVVKSSAPGLPNPDWWGDGSVPADCAIPRENTNPLHIRAVPERHLPMASSNAVVSVLRDFAGASTAAVLGPSPEGSWLGLDLEETYAADAPIELKAELFDAVPDEETRVYVRVSSDSVDKTVPATLGADGWSAVVPPLPVGTYRVRVEATSVPGADVVRCDDVVGVVSP